MNFKKIKILFVLGFVLFYRPAQASDIPQSLLGYWKVTEVMGSSKNLSKNQVPVAQFEGGILNFSSEFIQLIQLECSSPKIKLIKTKFSELSSTLGLKKGQALKDIYKLDIPGSEEVETLNLSCGSPPESKLPNDSNIYFEEKAAFLRKNGDLVLILVVDGIVITRAMAPGEIVKPSFDCAKASLTTEKAICQNPLLATLDQQVSKLYKFNLAEAKTNGPKCLKAVMNSQRDWMKKRNTCGVDLSCLKTSMKDMRDISSENPYDRFPKHCGDE